MKSLRFLICTTMVCVMLGLFSGCKNRSNPEAYLVKTDTIQAKPAALTGDQLIKRGNYLVTSIGCHDCHSPKRMGPQGPEDNPDLMFSGYQSAEKLPPIDKKSLDSGWLLFTMNLNAAVGPWGVAYAANLTSDPSGIGSWPEENFMRAIKQGKYKGLENGRPLAPVMPWINFTNLTDEDINSMFAYFKTTKPVNNVVPLAIAPEDVKYK
jgi:hypothetical protein